MFLKSKKNKNSFFLELGRKKKHINTDISFLQKRIKVKFFFAFDNRHTRKHIADSSWMLGFWEKSLEKRNHSVAKFVCASKPFQRDIAGKRFKVLIIDACGEKVHKSVGISKTSICNRFSNWCQKLRKMMDIDASRECSIFVPELWEWLNWLFQLIHFLVTFSILGFRRMRSQNLT